jgi:hypothetical protein
VCLYFSFLVGYPALWSHNYYTREPEAEEKQQKLCSNLRKNLLFFLLTLIIHISSWFVLHAECLRCPSVKESCKFTYPVFTKIQIHAGKMRAVKIREHLEINSFHGSLVERPYSTRAAHVQSQANTLYLNWAPSPSQDENKGGYN